MEKSIEMFIDRMNNVRYKGKHIAMDSTVQVSNGVISATWAVETIQLWDFRTFTKERLLSWKYNRQ